MELKYGVIFDADAIKVNLHRLTNQIYKLLPSREEGADWQKPLEIIVEEFAGMHRLLIGQQATLFSLLCKLEGLFTLVEDEDFQLYRRCIFECLSLVGELNTKCLA